MESPHAKERAQVCKLFGLEESHCINHWLAEYWTLIQMCTVVLFIVPAYPVCPNLAFSISLWKQVNIASLKVTRRLI